MCNVDLPCYRYVLLGRTLIHSLKETSVTLVAAVGFEPTPPKRLVPKTSALDRSATLPCKKLNS